MAYIPQGVDWDAIWTKGKNAFSSILTGVRQQAAQQGAAAAQPLAPMPAYREPSFMDKHGKTLLFGGGALAAVYLFTRKNK
ncbi:MAG: hypothetical protein R3322_00290 [Kiloniellales bacterium]|nr:hypothetical protein [Kiloniellales bacterium]